MLDCIRVLLAIGLLAAASFGASGLKQDESVRNAKNKEVLRYMNLAADPCVDFYEFACGTAGKSQKSSKDSAEAPEHALQNAIDRYLKVMLQEEVVVQDNPNYGRKVKDFYKSCIAAKSNGKIQQAFFANLINYNGGFPAVPGANWSLLEPNYNWQDTIANLRSNYAMDILIKIRVVPRKYNEVPTDKYLEPADTIIPTELCNAEATKRVDLQQTEYNAIRKTVAETLSGWLTLNMKAARQIAADIVAFEFEICAGIGLNDTIGKLLPEPRSLDVLSGQLANRIDLKKILNLSFKTPIYKPFIMSSWSYFDHLLKTIEAHNKTTIANYIMYRALSIFSLPPDENVQARTDYCLGLMKRHFPKQIGEMYFKKFINEALEDDIRSLFANLTIPFANILSTAPWSQNVASSMLHRIALALPPYRNASAVNIPAAGSYWHKFVEVLRKVIVDQKDYILEKDVLSPPDEVEAYESRLIYRPEKNRIEMGWGLLQTPFYHEQYPIALRYALIGQMLARELVNAFDYSNMIIEVRRRHSEQGKEQYKNRLECFRRQISNYMYNNPSSYDNDTEMSELIAISNGLNIAFDAYLNWLNSPNMTLPLLQNETFSDLNYTNTQLFFIAYAQMHCRPRANATSPTIILSAFQRHSLERYKVNGPMMNSIEFARDFHCLPGVQMNAADKCVIF